MAHMIVQVERRQARAPRELWVDVGFAIVVLVLVLVALAVVLAVTAERFLSRARARMDVLGARR